MIFWENRFLAFPLWPASLVYGFFIRFRNWCYNRKLCSISVLNAKVISVGNLTVGGTGKTPLVEKLAMILSDRGFRVGILSRGYGRNGNHVVIVSDGHKIRVPWHEAGDEPFLLAKRLKNLSIIVGKDRTEAGRVAVEYFHCDILILDDGFQHRRLNRNLDLVVIDAVNPWGNGWLIPAGPLREPKTCLNRAHAVILTRVDQIGDVEKKASDLQKILNKPIIPAFHRPVEWVAIPSGKTYPINFLKNKNVLVFAGIGNPASFQRTIKSQDVKIVRFLSFRDHCKYHRYRMKHIYRLAEKLGAVAIVTTEKDSVKIQDLIESEIPFFYLKINLEFKTNEHLINQVISQIFMS